jgi:hypothetical protein
MSATVHGHAIPTEAERFAVELSRRLRDLARSRTSGLCQQPGCQDRATFVCATMLSPLAHGAAGLRWNAVCVRHGSVFALATSTPRPGE